MPGQLQLAPNKHERTGPAQALTRATAIIATVDNLTSGDNTFTIRWTPAHKGVERNEQADETAKAAAEGRGGGAELEHLTEASLSHLTRKTTEYRDKGEGHCGADTRPRGPETQIPLMFRYERKWVTAWEATKGRNELRSCG